MFQRPLLFLITLLFTATAALGQNIRFSGKVVNDKNEPLAGVSVRLEGGTGISTNTEGRFTLNLTPGKSYSLNISGVGYAPQTVQTETISNTTGELLVVMQVASKDLSGITVTAGRTTRRETVNSIIAFQKNTNTVASVISAETIRRSPDRNTGEVLKRIPGASIQDGKFLVIRGLADRYNMAMLNGIPLSSTEPDRKTFSFDLIPSGMIDNIIINKAFVPEMPGEWAGGLVQVNTRDIPTKNFFTIQAGVGFNTQTISNEFYAYKGGKTDFLGVDDGTRDLPSLYKNKTSFAIASQAQKNAIGLQMKNVWNAAPIASPLNSNFQISGGFTSTLFKKRIGGIFGLTYNRQSRFVQQENSQYAFLVDGSKPRYGLGIDYEFTDNRYNQDVLIGALGGLTLELNNNNKISYKSLFNINATDYTILRSGTFNNSNALLDSARARELGYQQNMFWSNQITGEHNITALKTRLRWYGSFNILDGYSPDQRRVFYLKNNDVPGGSYLLNISDVLSQRSGNRLWQILSDYIYTGGGDVSRTFDLFGQKQTVKAGYMLQVRDRLFDALPFSTALVGNNEALRRQEAEQIFVSSNYSNNDEMGKLKFGLIQDVRYRYLGNTILNAGFLQFDNQFTPDLRVVWGVRVEDFDQLIGSVKKSDPRHGYSRVRDYLPGVNITYRLNSKTNLRLSGSQTVVRPEFREIGPFSFYDFELNASVEGFAALKRTKVTNLDLRYELYPRSGETFNVGVFYKNFDQPIEQLFFPAGGGSSIFNYRNVDGARAYGAEIELRKRLDFAAALKNFTFQTNLSYIYSRVRSTNTTIDVDRPMQGQSPYVINAALMYDHEKSGLNATVLFNQIGQRIAFVGNEKQFVPNIWESSRPLLDLQVSKKLFKSKGEVRLNVSDLLNQRLYFYQNTEVDKSDESFNKGLDAVRFSRRFGTNISISFGYNF